MRIEFIKYISQIPFLKVCYFVLLYFSYGKMCIFAAESILYCTYGYRQIDIRKKQLSITQRDLAEIAELGIATVKDIERGKGNPSLSTLEKICTVLGLEIHLELKKIVI